ncbi:MAG: maleylpyruvate isomerase N-terminal domain-containing protein [Actinobacteria bacterium]|nr:maleylpyruvate isomerase N-terminal domain-containing protein [Actinomycetota bacterium]
MESALKDFTVKGLAGHLVRSGARVGVYLDQPLATDASPVAAPMYYASILRDMDDADNLRVRSDGEAAASEGWEALVATHSRTRDELAEALRREPPDRIVRVFAGLVMLLDDYLETRIVELLVHTDDLAVSVGLMPPAPPVASADIAIRHLVEVARLDRGDRALLMALSRRERDDHDALRVF